MNSGGGIYVSDISLNNTISNSILWGNIAVSGVELLAFDESGVSHCDINQDGYSGNGNIRLNLLLVDPDGPDNIAGSSDDDLHFESLSPWYRQGR